MKKVLLALSTAVMLSGCASTESGTNYNEACLQNLQPGVTTKTQVISCMGEPNRISVNPVTNETSLAWVYVGVRATLFVGRGTTKSVGMLFDKDGKFVRIISQSRSNTRS